jgi:hypothetical protein
VWLSVTVSMWVVALLGVVWVFARRRDDVWQRQVAPLCKEGALVFLIYATWRKLGEITLVGTGDAYGRGRWVWHVERWVHLPNEATLQRWAMHATWFIRFMNAYYIVFHVAPLGIFLVWLYVRHRQSFAHWRNQLAFVSIVCQCILFIPLAPPRFFPNFGFIDTAARYGPSVYHRGGFQDPGQLAAMPSMHVAWAMLIGIGTVSVSTSRWRWIGAAHTLFTVLAVTLTGYHWLLDGIVSTSVLLVGMAIAASWNRRHSQPVDEPMLELAGQLADAT